MDRALVVLNPRARRGAAARDYERIRSDIEARFEARYTAIDTTRWLRDLDTARNEGVERVLVGGGDGTLHLVANALMRNWPTAALGAIGLGSSNDFHKPCRTRLRGIPVRVGAPTACDVGLATFEDEAGLTRRRYFFVSASIGLCARANRRFSTTPWLGVDATIAHAATSALVRHENISARLDERELLISNLSVMLTPYLAGAFRYDAERQPGQFAVHLCSDMGALGLLRAMLDLLRGRFCGESWSSSSLIVDLDREDDLELDGELFRARRVRFEAIPNALGVCS